MTPFSSPREQTYYTSTPTTGTPASTQATLPPKTSSSPLFRNAPSSSLHQNERLTPAYTSNQTSGLSKVAELNGAPTLPKTAESDLNKSQNLFQPVGQFYTGNQSNKPAPEPRKETGFNNVSPGGQQHKAMPIPQSMFQPVAPKASEPKLFNAPAPLGEFNDIPLGPSAVSQFKSETVHESAPAQPKPQQSLSGIPLNLADISQPSPGVPKEQAQPPFGPLRPQPQGIIQPVQARPQPRMPLRPPSGIPGSQGAAAPPPVNAYGIRAPSMNGPSAGTKTSQQFPGTLVSYYLRTDQFNSVEGVSSILFTYSGMTNH